jgi:hypothetical protein
VIDAFTGALQIHGLDPNSSIDVEKFYRLVVDTLRAHDGAVALSDHLRKDRESRGKWAIGSERKIGAADVHLGLEAAQPFGHGKTGKAKIVTHKDRPGQLPRPKAGELELVSDPDTGRVTWTLTLADPSDERPFRPTHLMERVSRYVENCVGPPSRNEVEGAVKGNAKAVRLAIDTLLSEGHFEKHPGPRNSHLLAPLKPYRETDDATASTSSDRVSTSSRTQSNPTSSTSSPPYYTRGDVDEVEGRGDELTSSEPESGLA